MTTKLDKELRREVDIGGKPYTVTLSPEGVRLTEKGRRKGQGLRWQDWVNGEAALAVALNASLSETAGVSHRPKSPMAESADAATHKRTVVKRSNRDRSKQRRE